MTRIRSKVGKPGESSQVFPLLPRRGAQNGWRVCSAHTSRNITTRQSLASSFCYKSAALTK